MDQHSVLQSQLDNVQKYTTNVTVTLQLKDQKLVQACVECGQLQYIINHLHMQLMDFECCVDFLLYMDLQHVNVFDNDTT